MRAMTSVIQSLELCQTGEDGAVGQFENFRFKTVGAREFAKAAMALLVVFGASTCGK